jgi:hypothetical protein
MTHFGSATKRVCLYGALFVVGIAYLADVAWQVSGLNGTPARFLAYIAIWELCLFILGGTIASIYLKSAWSQDVRELNNGGERIVRYPNVYYFRRR